MVTWLIGYAVAMSSLVLLLIAFGAKWLDERDDFERRALIAERVLARVRAERNTVKFQRKGA